ncbi:MAG TPA: adenylate/guanylate cyclase domain-containing protein [Acidimicrobiia bacterium]|nr:adenylate/guanylate cyclase domain-containing protein [Acidimicrobiia bacterium]
MLVLLFTDLEASTRLWEQHPEEMRPALARHDAILRDAVIGNGGSLVKTTGDGLLATFPSVGGCVTACVEAQRTLHATTWEPVEPLKVRMGINVGEAEERAGDLYGTAVNRAARIMAAGNGGQILLSALAAQLMRDSLPSGVTLRDLGTHRLKDLTQPEQLFEVHHPDLGTDFPPLATLDARPNNFPTQVSEFFGREAELEAARKMLGRAGVRLLTFTGPGGTGKTRLALQLAADLVGEHRDGAFVVDLSAEREAEAAFEAILRDLGIAGTREGSPLQMLKTKLADRDMLIVLDNFEQVTDAAVGVGDLIAHCPDVHVVVTSREALRVRGERVIAVAPLGLPDPRGSLASIAESDAVSLFVDRAQAASSDFTLNSDNAAAVAEITLRLDGLPLALELAAARLSVFAAVDLAKRLSERLDVLGTGARDLPARQRTLHSTIKWSYELLDSDERRVFQLMSVFSGARLDAIEEVAAAAFSDVDTLAALASLVDKSLVRSIDSGEGRRFSMLGTIRDYAAERLSQLPEEAAAGDAAHAGYFADYAAGSQRALEGDDAESVLADLVAELGNLRTAWQYWVAAGDLEQLRRLLECLWVLHHNRGWYQGVIELMTDFLGVLQSVPPTPETLEEEMTARAGLGRVLLAVRGYGVDVDEQFSRVLELSTSLEATSRWIPILRALATYHTMQADFPKAAAIGRQILDLAERDNDAAGLVEGHLVFGYTTGMAGDVEKGLGHIEEAIDLFRPAMHEAGRFRGGASPGVVARNAGALLLRQGGWPEQAAARAQEGLSVARSLHHSFSLAYALYHSGLLELQGHHMEAAKAHAVELAAVAAEDDWPVWRALASVLQGVALCGMGQPEEGIALTEAGSDLYRGLTTPPVFWPGVLGLRGQAFALAGRLPRALELIDEAIVATRSREEYYPYLRLLRGRFLTNMPQPDMRTAEADYRTTLGVARSVQDRMTELAASTQLVAVLRSQGSGGEVEGEELARVYGSFTEGFEEPELVEARAVLAVTA